MGPSPGGVDCHEQSEAVHSLQVGGPRLGQGRLSSVCRRGGHRDFPALSAMSQGEPQCRNACPWRGRRPLALVGYPILTVPTELVHGLPTALCLWGTAGSEATLIEIGHSYERARDAGHRASSGADLPRRPLTLRRWGRFLARRDPCARGVNNTAIGDCQMMPLGGSGHPDICGSCECAVEAAEPQESTATVAGSALAGRPTVTAPTNRTSPVIRAQPSRLS